MPVTAFMSVGTKAAAFAMIVRVFATGLPGLSGEWAALLAFVAAASMIVGNLAAIAQSSVKRLLAYSGIAQAGYVLVGVIAGGADGQASVLFYLAAYLVMNFGAFAIMVVLAGPDGDRDRIGDLDGLVYRNPVLGVLMTVFMLSLAGFPPSVGFMGKFFLFAAGVHHGFTWLVVLAVLMSVVSVYYYFRVVIHIWTPVEAAEERLLMGLRTVDGVPLAELEPLPLSKLADLEDAGFVPKRRTMHYDVLGDPMFRERDVPRMLELATARADGDSSIAAELRLYPARSRFLKSQRSSLETRDRPDHSG